MASQSLVEWYKVENTLPLDEFPERIGIMDLYVAYQYKDGGQGDRPPFYRTSSYWKSDGWQYKRERGKFTSFDDMGYEVLAWCYLPSCPIL